MKTIEFKALPDETTPLNPTNLNKMQSNVKDVFDGNESIGSIVVEDIECKNLFDKNAIQNGYYLNESGALVSISNYCVSDFIPVEPGQKYYIPARDSSRTKYYLADKTAYSNTWDVTGDAQVITIPANVKYIRMSLHLSGQYAVDLNTFQFEKGDTATSFVEYKEFDNRPRLLWSNSNPKAGFNSQNIVLSSSNYDYLLINYKKNITDLIGNTVIIKKGQTAKLDMFVISDDNAKKYLYERYLTYNSDTSYTFTNAVLDSNTDVRNWLIIPTEILGFKISR